MQQENEKYVLIKDDGCTISDCIIFNSKEDLINYKKIANMTAIEKTKLSNVPMFKTDIEKGDDVTFDNIVTGIEVKEGEWYKLDEMTNPFESAYDNNISFIKTLTTYYSDGELSDIEEGDCFVTSIDKENTNPYNSHNTLSIDKIFDLASNDDGSEDKLYICVVDDEKCKMINCYIILYKKFEKFVFDELYKGKSRLYVSEECGKTTDEMYTKYYDDIMVKINECLYNLIKVKSMVKSIIDGFSKSAE